MSFAQQVGQAIQQQGSPAPVPIQAGVQGGGVSGAAIMGAPEVSSGAELIGRLLPVAEKALAPLAAKMQKEAYISGMTKAAAGQAIADIEAEQPWYSGIFGPSQQLQGARAYEAQAQSSRFIADIATDMQELRKLTPESFAQQLVLRMETYASGDTEADVQGKAMMFEHMPVMIQQHTKELHKYGQEQARETRLKAGSSAAAAFNSTMVNGMLTPEQAEDAAMGFVAGFRPQPGENPDTHQADLMTNVEAMVTRGQFHALGALERHGVFSFLPEESRAKLEVAIKESERKYAIEGRVDYAQEWITMGNDARNGVITAEQVFLRANEINKEYAAKTGNRYPMYAMADTEGVYASALQAQAAIVNANLRESQKGADSAAEYDAVMAELRGGTTTSLLLAQGAKRGVVEQAFMDIYGKLSPAEKIKMMVHHSTADGAGVPKVLQTQLNRKANSTLNGQITEGFREQFQMWKDMGAEVGGERARAHWWNDPDVTDTFMEFNTVLGDRSVLEYGEQAFAIARQNIRLRTGSLDKATEKAMDKYLDKSTARNGIFGFFTDKLTGPSRQMLRTLMSERVAANSKHIPVGDQLFRLSAEQVAGKFERYGNHLWAKTDELAPLANYMQDGKGGAPITKEILEEGFQTAIDNKMKATVHDAEEVTLYRVADDAAGRAQFTMMVNTGDSIEWVPLNSDEIRTSVRAWYADKVKRADIRKVHSREERRSNYAKSLDERFNLTKE